MHLFKFVLVLLLFVAVAAVVVVVEILVVGHDLVVGYILRFHRDTP